jgi:hypothetical protein
MTKGDGWLAKRGDRWLNKEMRGKVGSAPACYGSSLGSNPDISQNTKWTTLAKEWSTLSSPPKIYKKSQTIQALDKKVLTNSV